MTNKLIRNASIFLLVVGIIMAISYYQSKSKLKSSFVSKSAQEYMTGFSVTHFTESGDLKDTLTASSWAYLPDKQYSKLEAPILSIMKSDGLWHVSANQAYAWHKTLDQKPDKIDLWDNVVIERPEQAQLEPVLISTEKLIYFPEKEDIETDLPISMVKPDLTLTGVGMQGNLNNNFLQLKSEVKTYVNNQK